MLIKEAAKSLLDRNEITSEEYDFLKENYQELEKISFEMPWETIRKVGVGIAAGTGTAFAAEELYKKLAQRVAIGRSFETMKQKMPVLQEYPEDQVKDYFDVIKTFSPKSASNPLVAGALVHKMLEFGGVDHKLIQDISKIEDVMPSGFLYETAKSGIGGFSQLPQKKHNR